MGVRIENLSLKYGDKLALDDINLEVNDGEFLVILGSSGSGKTTLLRCISGLIEPTEGSIYIDEVDVTGYYPSDRNVAMVFQNFALYPHMTVYDNISLNLKLKKLQRNDIEKRVNDVARLLHIDSYLKKYPKQLSGGEQQRVGLARAMVRDPSVYLMDEPLSNLDAKLRHEMLGELRNFHDRVRKTTIYVCHDQDEAMALADRIVIINRGRIVQIGDPTDLYDHPQDAFVASFIGNPPMNLLDCTVSKEDGVGALYFQGKRIVAVPDLQDGTERVILGIRPENLIPDVKGPIEAEFDYTILSGNNNEINALADGKPFKAVVERNTNNTSEINRYQHGDILNFSIGTGILYIFNAETGKIVKEMTLDEIESAKRSDKTMQRA